MGRSGIKKAIGILAAALFLETVICNGSFWRTLFAKGEDLTDRMEVLYGVSPEELQDAPDGSGEFYEENGYRRVPAGFLWLRVTDLNEEVRRLWIDVDLPTGYPVKATVFVQDEGNQYPCQLGEGRILLREVKENARMKLYPYGKVKNLYIRLETADETGNAAAGSLGDLVLRLRGLSINGTIPFSFSLIRFLIWLALAAFCLGLSARGKAVELPFAAKEEDRRGRLLRKGAVVLFTALLLCLCFLFVQINPDCKSNLALHHAQYQELARALARGEVSVGEADPLLLKQENPYDTIALQAGQIPYRADYALYRGKYYVYFGIVPELLLYLPWYRLTGGDLQNYQAVFVFLCGLCVSAAGLVWELMKRWFPRQPFWLCPVGILMLTGSSSLFYLMIRPDLYHVPIAAACMFVTAGLWCYLAGLNRERNKFVFYALGSLCMALTAGCRPQFLLFSMLAFPLFWKEAKTKRTLFSRRGIGETAALLLPFLAVGAGLMYYNAIRFGSPFDFGASYSLTSNDMTHRGFNMERVWYGVWYFLFQPFQLEGSFPFLEGAQIRTDYLGRMVSESVFGGIFACSMLTWPVFLLYGQRKKLRKKELAGFSAVCVVVALLICGIDAAYAGILQRYTTDLSLGLFLAAFIGLLVLSQQAAERGIYSAFVNWLKAAILLHLLLLGLILIQTEGSVTLQRGNPVLYYTIQAALRW